MTDSQVLAKPKAPTALGNTPLVKEIQRELKRLRTLLQKPAAQ